MAHMLDSDQLRTFVAIVDSGSFTRAAEIVHKTQSAVSMQVKRLEERVGHPVFERDGRLSRLTPEGERLLEYARRIVRLNTEAVASLSDKDLTGRVRLGIPDDYAERYLPEILVRFSRLHPRAEVTVICEPTQMLLDRISAGALDLAIVTRAESHDAAEMIRTEQLLWVTSARHATEHETPLPLALGRQICSWRQAATDGLEEMGRPFRILYVSWYSTAVGAAVLAGLAVSVLPESAIRPGMRILGPRDGFPLLPSCKIGLVERRGEESDIVRVLADEIRRSLDNLASGQLSPAAVAAE